MKLKKLTPDETAYFCEQLAIMLSSGMNLGDGISILGEDIDDERIQAVCGILARGLNDGGNLADAMESAGVFPEYAVKMVRIGVITGRVENVLNGLSDYYEERAELNRSVRTAVLHPLMLLVMMTAVIIVMMVLVIPMFGDIFSQFDGTVNDAVKGTIDFAYGLGTVILVVLLVVIAVMAAVAVMSGIPAAKDALSRFAAVFPPTAGISWKIGVSKVSSALSMMISAGISSDEAVENAIELVNGKKLRSRLEQCRSDLLDGMNFADAITRAEIFPAIYSHSLKIAYTSGSFERAWKKLADRSAAAAMQSVSGVIAFVEPLIIVILTALIGAILLTVMIPLMNIMSVLG